MSEPRESQPCKLFVSVIFSSSVLLEQVQEEMEERIGLFEMHSRRFPFDKTEYYREEMGTGLKRIFFVFQGTFGREFLVEAKHACFELENLYSIKGRRRVNLDPGIVTLENVVLATFKNYSHRIYIRKGVYGDLTFRYVAKQFTNLPWTYPDLREEGVASFFQEVRDRLTKEIGGREISHVN